MFIESYQKYVKEGASSNYDKKLAIIGVMGEVGELADVVKKEAIYSDMSKFEAKYGMTVRDKIADECGDVLWQLVNLLNQYDLDIVDVINNNVSKLNSRHGGAGKTATDGGGQR